MTEIPEELRAEAERLAEEWAMPFDGTAISRATEAILAALLKAKEAGERQERERLTEHIPQSFSDAFAAHRHWWAAKDLDLIARKDAKEYRMEADWLKPFMAAIRQDTGRG